MKRFTKDELHRDPAAVMRHVDTEPVEIIGEDGQTTMTLFGQYDPIECCDAAIEVQKLREQVRVLTISLHNVRAFTKRYIRKSDPASAAHLLRFCESAGITDQFLRDGGLPK